MSISKRPLQFAYSTINWDTKPDLAAACREIQDAGWSAVELFDHPLDWLGSVDTLRRVLGGLRVATFFGVIEVPVDAVQLTIHKRRIEYAARMGATMYGLVGGTRLRWRSPSDEEYTNLAGACEDLAIFGANYGVGVAYHPHTGCTIETEGEIDILLNRTQKALLCLDVSHIALVDEDLLHHLRKYRERLGYVHIKDWAQGRFVELGRGTLGIDFQSLFAELEAQAFTGWIVVENSRSDESPARSACLNADYVRNMGYTLYVAGWTAS